MVLQLRLLFDKQLFVQRISDDASRRLADRFGPKPVELSECQRKTGDVRLGFVLGVESYVYFVIVRKIGFKNVLF